ncbi:sensor histidine kinase [Microbacterium karelineae]|uniref:sensor histidine kinase n=1 Tax=Microbacterium karelineae TaxID=2654283 RepID=UPI001E373DE5|nr:sensor histidine kinase [Microbacterium karelineae]
MRADLSRTAVDPRLVDAVLAVAMALAVAVTIVAYPAPPGPTPWAFAFAALFGALLLLRRRLPRTMLAITVLSIFVYYALGFAPIGITLPAVAALYSCAEVGRTWFAIGAGGVLVGVAAYFRVSEGQGANYLLGYELLTNVALVAAAVSLGVAIRRTREAREQTERIRMLTEAEQAQASARTLQDERVRIARELHDTVGHALSVVSVHAGVAAESIGRDDSAASAAIAHVRDASSQTLHDLRTTVRLLRSPGEAARMGNGLGALDALIGPATATGLEVSADIDVPAGSVDAAIDAAAYRIVQESLTNVIRHAGARRVDIRARIDGDELSVTVADDGRGRGVASTDGAGLAGMRERAHLLGGSLEAGDGRFGGFRVAARLPARLEAS